MYIKNLSLTNFRGFKEKKFEFSDKVSVIVGANAVGKTNILEAINLLSTGKSFKARLEGEMLSYNSDVARIKGVLENIKFNDSENSNASVNGSQLDTSLEVILTNGMVQIGEDPGNIKKTQKKKMLVNGVPKRLVDFMGNLKVVLFGPWDLELVTEAPSHRRNFLDMVLSQTDRDYRRSVMIYEKGLRQRNRLLLRIRDEGISRGQLMYWDKLLIKHGEYLTKKREELTTYINEIQDYSDRDYSLTYDKSIISEARFAQYEREEVAAAKTLVGPHRDDILFKLKDQTLKREVEERDLARYGSRGEARMGVLWLKLAELSYIELITGEKPILLLDDIFSELDHEHRDIVMGVCNNQQTIITTADVHNIEGIRGVEIINING